MSISTNSDSLCETPSMNFLKLLPQTGYVPLSEPGGVDEVQVDVADAQLDSGNQNESDR